MKLGRLVPILITALLVAGPLASPAQALTGDSHLDPIELPTVLPMTIDVDTSMATADASDPPADQPMCYENQWGATTFYSFTPPVDTLVEPAGGVGANLYTAGPDGSLTWYDGTNCEYIRGPVTLVAGREYIIMVGSNVPGVIGTLTLRERPPEVQFEMTLTSTWVDPRTGIAHLSGTGTCNTEAEFYVVGDLTQTRGRQEALGEFYASGYVCDESRAVDWVAEVDMWHGRFRPGSADLRLRGEAYNERPDWDVELLIQTVRLRARK